MFAKLFRKSESSHENVEKTLCPEISLRAIKEGNKVAVLACGPQLKFERTLGVARCIVGYSGGKSLNPTYQRIKDHTEALLVEYDPAVIRYDELLVKWARNAYPYGKEKTQYRNAIFFTNFDQQSIAEEVCAKIRDQGKAKGQQVHIEIEQITKFYKAEGYHQDFLAKRGA